MLDKFKVFFAKSLLKTNFYSRSSFVSRVLRELFLLKIFLLFSRPSFGQLWKSQTVTETLFWIWRNPKCFNERACERAFVCEYVSVFRWVSVCVCLSERVRVLMWFSAICATRVQEHEYAHKLVCVCMCACLCVSREKERGRERESLMQ